jgi:hypothetical protein
VASHHRTTAGAWYPRAMRVRFHKLSDERHALEIVRDDGGCERVECETRSYLFHDFLHFAVESEARLATGFWGSLAAGKTLAALNDRSKPASTPEMARIEQVVGMLAGLAKGRSAAEISAALSSYQELQGDALPGWVTPPFVYGVEERLRQLTGHYRATAYGAVMELEFRT